MDRIIEQHKISSFFCQVVSNPEEADFILAHGTDALGRGGGAEPEPASIEAIQGRHSALF